MKKGFFVIIIILTLIGCDNIKKENVMQDLDDGRKVVDIFHNAIKDKSEERFISTLSKDLAKKDHFYNLMVDSLGSYINTEFSGIDAKSGMRNALDILEPHFNLKVLMKGSK